jgi:hypothetical protein
VPGGSVLAARLGASSARYPPTAHTATDAVGRSAADHTGGNLAVEPAALDEDLGQPFRLADYQAVTGVDFVECLHTAASFSVDS